MTSLRILVICKHTLTVALFYHIHSAHSTVHVIAWDGLEGSGGLESLGRDSSSLEFEFERGIFSSSFRVPDCSVPSSPFPTLGVTVNFKSPHMSI